MPASLRPLSFAPITLLSTRQLSPDVVHLTFALQPHESLHSLSFDLGLGDFIRIKPPGVARGRAYSPTSHQSTLGFFSITVKVYPSGAVSQYLSNMKPHDTVPIAGPLPIPWLTKKLATGHTTTLVVALGIDITESLLCCQSELLAGRTVKLLYSVKTESDLILLPELAVLMKQHPDTFTMHTTLTRAGGDRLGPALFLKLFASVLALPPAAVAVLVVGTKEMNRIVYGHLNELKLNKRLLGMAFRAPWGRRHSPLHENCVTSSTTSMTENETAGC